MNRTPRPLPASGSTVTTDGAPCAPPQNAVVPAREVASRVLDDVAGG
jgi:hypothetical protein